MGGGSARTEVLLVRVHNELLHDELQLGQDVLQQKSVHVALTEHALPRLQHHLGADVRRVPVQQRVRQLVADRSVQWLQLVL